MTSSTAPNPTSGPAPDSDPASDSQATPSAGSAASSDAWPTRDSWKGSRKLWDLAYRVVMLWGASLVRNYYRLEMYGEEFPKERPVLLVQNHTNGLVDAHLLMSATPRPLRLLVKFKLLKMPVVGWMLRSTKAVPMYRKKDGVDTRQNAASFDAIDTALREGAVIGLFPEGESLNSIGVRPLKSGVARMAISADESPDGSIGLLVVPIGVTYEDRDRFRSTVVGVIGEPIEVAPIIESCGETWRRAIPLIMGRIRDSLESLTLHAETEDEHATAVALERILETTSTPLGLRRRAALALLKKDTGPNAERRAQAIRELGDRLAKAGLRGDDVLAPAPTAFAVAIPPLWAGPLSLFNLIAWGPPIALGLIASRSAPTPDKLVTTRMLFTSTPFPIWILILVGTAWFFGGAAAALAAVVGVTVSLLTFARSIDALRGAARAARLRALKRTPTEAEASSQAIRSIREAFISRADARQVGRSGQGA